MMLLLDFTWTLAVPEIAPFTTTTAGPSAPTAAVNDARSATVVVAPPAPPVVL